MFIHFNKLLLHLCFICTTINMIYLGIEPQSPRALYMAFLIMYCRHRHHHHWHHRNCPNLYHCHDHYLHCRQQHHDQTLFPRSPFYYWRFSVDARFGIMIYFLKIWLMDEELSQNTWKILSVQYPSNRQLDYRQCYCRQLLE